MQLIKSKQYIFLTKKKKKRRNNTSFSQQKQKKKKGGIILILTILPSPLLHLPLFQTYPYMTSFSSIALSAFQHESTIYTYLKKILFIILLKSHKLSWLLSIIAFNKYRDTTFVSISKVVNNVKKNSDPCKSNCLSLQLTTLASCEGKKKGGNYTLPTCSLSEIHFTYLFKN